MRQKKPIQTHLRQLKTVLPFLAPSLGGLCVFVLIPFADTVRRSFCNAMGNRWVGLTNYTQVLTNSAFQLAAENTAKFLCVCLPLLLGVSLALALMVRAQHRKNSVFQSTFLLPMAVPVSAIVLLWKVLFSDSGLVNGVIASLGGEPVSFLSTNAAFWVLVVTYLWKNAGYDMILWLAGLDNISRDLYEAAAADGAGPLQQFRYITLPELRPMVGVVGLLSLINSFKVFREAYLVAGNYPHESMYLLQHLFNNWFLDLDMGRLTAAACLMVLVLLGVIALGRRYWRLETG
ncbi:MAG: sugar ABC transporter permease [Clostridiales bacterium]|nr:sugar ABC transporter permease [Clostridiales bacterium]